MHNMPGSRSIWSGLPGSSGSIENGAIWNWASGRSSSGRVLKNPTMSQRGRRQRPAPGRLVLLGRRLLAGLGAEQLVVAEVLGEPELQHEHAVLAHPGADVRAVHHDVDAGGPQRVRGADAGELEDLGRGDAARREDHLAVARASTPCPFRRPCTPTARPPSSTTRSTIVCSATVRLGRSMTGCRNALAALTPLAVADRRHRVADALLVGLVEVAHPPPAELGAGGDHVLEQRVGPVDGRDVQRAARAADVGGAERVVLDRLEDRQHVVPAPARVAETLERVVVRAVAAVVDHAVDRARPAERLAPHPVLDLLRRPERAGRVVPRGGRVAQQLAEPPGHGDQRVGVPVACLDQQHADPRVRGEAVGEHTPRRSRADDDVVELRHGLEGLRGGSPSAIPGSWVRRLA